jgi:hypothetical protein
MERGDRLRRFVSKLVTMCFENRQALIGKSVRERILLEPRCYSNKRQIFIQFALLSGRGPHGFGTQRESRDRHWRQ